MSALPINVEDLKPGGVEPLHEDRQKSLHHLIAEMMVRLALAAEARRIDADRPGEFHGARVERPAIGWDEPGGTDDLSFSESRYDDRCLPGRNDLKGHLAVSD